MNLSWQEAIVLVFGMLFATAIISQWITYRTEELRYRK